MIEEVWITGVGAISPLGHSQDAIFDALISNQSGVQTYPEWRNLKGLHSFLGSPAKPFSVDEIPRVKRRSMSRMSEMATLATIQALKSANLTLANQESDRVLFCMGSTSGSPYMLEEYYRKYFERGGPEGQLSTSFFKVMNHSVAANVTSAMDFKGPLLAPSSACSTSSQTVTLAWELLRKGTYDCVVAGAADELHSTTAAIFDTVMAASRGYNDRPDEAPRPFDQHRDGLVVGEGAGILVLERATTARDRGARPLAILEGASYRVDGSHMTQPQPDSMEATLRNALSRAGIEAKAVDYVSAHATGTVQGDALESQAIGRVMGDSVPVSSLKGHFGHTLAACGTLEVISAMAMMDRGFVIPTRNLKNIDPQCQHLNLPKEPLKKALHRVMINNFAFGGMNNSIILRKV